MFFSTTKKGNAAEDLALHHLEKAGLKLVERNYRTPGRGGGEIDLIVRAADGTLVFVEVRQRDSAAYGGASASISATKRQRIIHTAQHYLMQQSSPPPCRFDVVTLQGPTLEWIPHAFDLS